MKLIPFRHIIHASPEWKNIRNKHKKIDLGHLHYRQQKYRQEARQYTYMILAGTEISLGLTIQNKSIQISLF